MSYEEEEIQHQLSINNSVDQDEESQSVLNNDTVKSDITAAKPEVEMPEIKIQKK